MAQRVSVGMTFGDTLFIVAMIFAPLLAIGAILVLAFDGPSELAVVLLIIAAPFVILAIVRARTISRNRRWLTPTETGFILTDFRGEFEFSDDMVSDLATWAKAVYSNGVPSKNRRTGSFVITAGDSSVTFDFHYDFPLGQPDPLGDMLQRIFDRLVAVAKEMVQRGGRLTGQNWWLDRNELVTIAGREEIGIPLREVAAIDITEGKVCVWRRGEAEAVLRVPAGAPNALVMGRVLQDLAPPPAEEEPPADGLGRVIFERDGSVRGANLIAGIILVILGFVIGGGLVIGTIVGPVTWIGGVIGGVMVLAAIAGVAYIREKRINVFRCHAFGVAHTTPHGVRKLRYANVGSFTYSGIRQYVNGAYAGTTVNLHFLPLDPDRDESVTYSATFKNADEELDNLRDFISRVVAGHMFQRLRDGTPVPWFAGVVFHPTGLELRRVSGWRKKKGEPELVGYERITATDVTDGVFRLAIDGDKKWAVEESVGQPNFFPGFFVLMTILHPPPEEPAADQPATTEN